MGAKRFQKGALATDIAAVITGICSDRWYFLNDRPCHPAFLRGMTVSSLVNMIRWSRIAEAIEAPKAEAPWMKKAPRKASEFVCNVCFGDAEAGPCKRKDCPIPF